MQNKWWLLSSGFIGVIVLVVGCAFLNNPDEFFNSEPVPEQSIAPPSSPMPMIKLIANYDTYVHKKHLFLLNHWDDKTMKVAPYTAESKKNLVWSFVNFDIDKIPYAAKIHSAILTLCLDGIRQDEAGRTHTLRRVLYSWPEDGLEFPGPSVSEKITDEVMIPEDPAPTEDHVCLSYDVTYDVQLFVSGKSTPNHGWRISDEGESNNKFDDTHYFTREATNPVRRPMLKVLYSI